MLLNTRTYLKNFSLCILCVVVCSLNLQAAEIDGVYLKSSDKSVKGEITTISKTEVVVTQKVGNKEEHIPANDIRAVEYKAEPLGLGLARSNELAGNLSEALTGFTEALTAAETDNVKADIQFLLARTAYKIAQADSAQLPAAVDALQKFVSNNRDHFRFYDAQMLLAEAGLESNDTAIADTAFSVLEQAPWQDYKMAGQIGSARSLIAQNNAAGARAIFDKVAEMAPQTDAEKARRLEAMIGQATCSKLSKDFAAATLILKKVVEETTAQDTRLLAEAYLNLGDCYAADGSQLKDAVLAYLHVDVIPSLANHKDLHAQALYQLAKTWPAIGQPARGAEASAKLEQEYPNSEWTKKLGAGS